MVDNIISADETSDFNLVGGDTYTLLAGVNHIYTSGSLTPVLDINGGVGSEVNIFGTVFSTASRLFDEDNSSVFTSVYIGTTGSLIAQEDAFSVDSNGDDFSLTNLGSISGGQMNMSGDRAEIVNAGTISGTFASAGYVAAIEMSGQDSTTINTGTITSTSSSIIRVTSTNAMIVNHGSMVGTEIGIDFATTGTEVATLINTGTISAVGLVVEGSSGADTVNNRGTIAGEISLGGNDDEVINSGTILGAVDLGNGDDTYRGIGDGFSDSTVDGGLGSDLMIGGILADVFDGGDDNDTLVGRDGDDQLFGNSGEDDLRGGNGADELNGGLNDDSLTGGNGDDVLYGDEGDDTLRGGNGDDELNGGEDNDLLVGNANADVLSGNAGNDVLNAGDGEDVLVGGTGRDVLRGGNGGDTFIFETLSDSGTGALRDVINGFTTGEDLIDLRDISGDVIDFLGTGGFTGSGSAELRLTTTATGFTIINVDEDGDSSADFQLLVRGLDGTLTADDFLL